MPKFEVDQKVMIVASNIVGYRFMLGEVGRIAGMENSKMYRIVFSDTWSEDPKSGFRAQAIADESELILWPPDEPQEILRILSLIPDHVPLGKRILQAAIGHINGTFNPEAQRSEESGEDYFRRKLMQALEARGLDMGAEWSGYGLMPEDIADVVMTLLRENGIECDDR